MKAERTSPSSPKTDLENSKAFSSFIFEESFHVSWQNSFKLSNRVYFNFRPQVYYLKMDEQDGFYFTSAFALAIRDFPLSLQAIINKVIQTDISASKDFVWNVSLVFSFNQEFARKQRLFQ